MILPPIFWDAKSWYLIYVLENITHYSWFHTFAVFYMFYSFFWVISRRQNFICRRFGPLCLFHLHRHGGMKILYTYLPMKMEQIEWSETSAYKILTQANYPEENIQYNTLFLISYFRRVLHVLFFLLGNFPASEFYMPTFRTTLSVPSS